MDDITTCCGNEDVIVTRVLFFDPTQKANIDHIRGIKAFSQAATEYKALSRRFGNTRRTQRNNITNGMQFKANAGRQILSTIGSIITPGDMGPIRSPVRSAIYRTITPGFGGGRRGGSRPGENRAHRCPEGYQYGGRFTDNRLSTCGAKLFAVPSALGATIGAIRRATTSALPQRTAGRDLTGASAAGDALIISRTPQIPRVGAENASVAKSRTENQIKEIGQFNKSSSQKARRMVRRDGFVLEPVVPNKVLRAIPDNRDMEGAYFVMSALSPKDIGAEELGLLSNTGVRSLIYVLPGGSSITLEKARTLQIGERRKLGRVVNTAQQIDNTRDPAKRLRNVAAEIGPGLKYSENFVGVKNPNELVGGRISWASQIWGKRPIPGSQFSSVRDTESFGPRRKLIGNVNDALQHVVNGGSLSDIDPKIMPTILAKTSIIQKQRMANNITAILTPSEQMFLYERPTQLQHIGERFASDVQQSIGLESPDILFADKPGDTRKFLRQDVISAIPGGTFNPDAKFNELEPRDVAALAISDFLTDQRQRPSSSIYTIDTADARRLISGQNSTSGLIDLSKIEITKRMKMRIEEFYAGQGGPSYSDYYQALKAEQRAIFLKYLSQLINKARSFDAARFRDTLGQYGLSEGEKIHLNIVEKLFNTRLEILSNQKTVLRSIIIGGRQ